MTYLCGVIGDPVAQSLSPLIHSAWLRDHSIDGSYKSIPVRAAQFRETMRRFETDGVHRLNVTMPHKKAALDIAGDCSQEAARIGVANTLTYKSERGWFADNTDAAGFIWSFTEALGSEIKGSETLKGRKIILLGAGGAARSIVYALDRAGAQLIILNRTEARAELVSDELTDRRAGTGGLDQLAALIRPDSIVVNTSGAGHSGQLIALPPQAGQLFYDISYGSAAIAQLKAARALGWQVEDGLAMLVGQAAESFHIWFDCQPDRKSALSHCREALKRRT